VNKEIRRLYWIILRHNIPVIDVMSQDSGVTNNHIITFYDGACVVLKPIVNRRVPLNALERQRKT